MRLFNLNYFLISSFVFVLTTSIQAVLAEPQVLCKDNEYIFWTNNNRAARERVLELAQTTSSPSQKAKVEEASSHAMKVDIHSRNERSLGTDNDGWVPCNHEKLCEQIESQGRADRRRALQSARSDDPTSRPKASNLRRDFSSCSGNMKLDVAISPNDPYMSLLYGMTKIEAPAAWDKTTGSNDVIVAVIDTGIDFTHPDLAANMWTNPNEIAGNGVDDDQNGVIDDIYGFNAITNGAANGDDHGHGTHCAGTIGGRGDNSIGVAGVNWNIKLMSIKFLDSNGSGSTYDAIEGIEYTTALKNKGFPIVATSNSWSGGGYSSALYNAINQAKQAGVLFIAAAGNAGMNNDSYNVYPANYSLDNIISVAASDQYDSKASFSNYGVQTVDIAAPGVSIASTVPGNKYAWMSGTSMATPHVAGAVGLLRAYNPSLSWQETRDLILYGADQISGLASYVPNGRRLNINKSLLLTHPGPSPTPTPPPGPTPTPAPTATPIPATPTPVPSPGTWTIAGSLTLNGNIVAGAEVELKTDSGAHAFRVTGPSGQFSFSEVDGPTDYTITVRLNGADEKRISGYLTQDVWQNISLNKKLYTVKFSLVDTKGRPIPNLIVNLEGVGASLSNSSGIASFQAPFATPLSPVVSSSEYVFQNPKPSGDNDSSIVLGNVTRVLQGRTSYE